MVTTSNAHPAEARAADVSIPLIRAAATIGFTIAPCSLGFVIVAVSDRLIRAIMVGDDPEMLVSDLQNQFPSEALKVNENDSGLVSKVVALIERLDQTLDLPLDSQHGPYADVEHLRPPVGLMSLRDLVGEHSRLEAETSGL
jgi:hypothetical protein